MTKERVILGVISDTHGLLRPRAVEALRGSDLILHAGDAGAPEILEALAHIAPVTAIRGNVDTGAWARSLPTTESIPAGGISLYMLHDLGQLDLKPRSRGIPRGDIRTQPSAEDGREKRRPLLQSRQRGPASIRLAGECGKADDRSGEGARGIGGVGDIVGPRRTANLLLFRLHSGSG